MHASTHRQHASLALEHEVGQWRQGSTCGWKGHSAPPSTTSCPYSLSWKGGNNRDLKRARGIRDSWKSQGAAPEAAGSPGKDTFTELSHPFQETLSRLSSNKSIPYCVFENCIFPTPKDSGEGQRPCWEGQHSVPQDKNALWSANHQYQKARMPSGEESISCAWQSWQDSWRELGGWNVCVEDLWAKSLSRAKAARARGWGHYLMDKTSRPPGWTRRGADVWGLLRTLIICEGKRKGVGIKKLC